MIIFLTNSVTKIVDKRQILAIFSFSQATTNIKKVSVIKRILYFNIVKSLVGIVGMDYFVHIKQVSY